MLCERRRCIVQIIFIFFGFLLDGTARPVFDGRFVRLNIVFLFRRKVAVTLCYLSKQYYKLHFGCNISELALPELSSIFLE